MSGVKVYQSAAAGADEVIMELDFGWSSDAEMSMIVHPMPHQAWLATPVVEVLSKLIVVKVCVLNAISTCLAGSSCCYIGVAVLSNLIVVKVCVLTTNSTCLAGWRCCYIGVAVK